MTSASPTTRAPDRRIALLIDADNISHAKIAAMVGHMSALGSLHIRRAYGDWSNDALKHWKEVLHAFAIQPVQQFSYTSGKNASDMALVIDAMELVFTQSLDAVCIASSDADFTPLVMRLKSRGLDVYGCGDRKTPVPFVAACTRFHVLDDAEAAKPPRAAPLPASATAKPKTAPVASKTPPPSKTATATLDLALVASLRRVVEATARDDGWAPMSTVGQVAKQAAIDPRRYGAKNYTGLFAKIGAFDVVKCGGSAFVSDRLHRGRAARPA